MAPLGVDGIHGYIVREVRGIEELEVGESIVSDEIVVPNGALLKVFGVLGLLSFYGLFDGGTINGKPMWKGERPVVFQQGKEKVTVKATKNK